MSDEVRQRLRGAPRALRFSCAALLALGTLPLSPTPAVADSVRDSQWMLQRLDIAKVHTITQGEGVTVAVVDTGVNGSHPDLQGSVVGGTNAWDGLRGDGQQDDDGHGTAMAAIIAGHGHGPAQRDGVLGMAPKAKLLSISVQPPDRKTIDSSAIGPAIRWAVDHGAKIINVSITGSTDASERSALAYAQSRGAIVVGGVGNLDNGNVMGFPAADRRAVAVSGTDRTGKFWSGSVQDPKVEFAAPAVEIVSAAASGGYRTGTGTSGSTAVVSGALALVWSKYPDLTKDEVLHRLRMTATDVGPPGRDPQYGYGVPDVVKALTANVAPSAAPSLDPGTAPSLPSEITVDGSDPVAVRVVGILVVVAVPVSIVALVARLIVRRRRRRSAGAGPAGPEGPSPVPVRTGPTGPPQRTGDSDARWQRPQG